MTIAAKSHVDEARSCRGQTRLDTLSNATSATAQAQTVVVVVAAEEAEVVVDVAVEAVVDAVEVAEAEAVAAASLRVPSDATCEWERANNCSMPSHTWVPLHFPELARRQLA